MVVIPLHGVQTLWERGGGKYMRAAAVACY